MIDGIWWLVILLSVVLGLWLLAKTRATKSFINDKGQQTFIKQSPTNDALQKTLILIKKHFPNYQVSRKANHLSISHQGKKMAMITIDKRVATGQRLLGEVPVINYHRVPTQELLMINLREVK